MRKTLLCSLAALSLVGATAPASAETVTITIPTEDLDLTKAADLELLETRVERAAWQACRATSSSILALAAVRNCRNGLIEGASKEIARLREEAVASAEASELALAS